MKPLAQPLVPILALLVVVLAALVVATPASGVPELVKNINESDTGANSSPRFVRVGSGAIFVANGGPALDLWRTDGTPGGTDLLADGIFDSVSTSGTIHATLDDVVYLAHRGVPGLWRSDGSAMGTEPILVGERVVALASLPAAPRLLMVTVVDARRLRLEAFDPADGSRQILANVSTPGFGLLPFFQFAEVGGRLLVGVIQPISGMDDALWVTDGTPDNTIEIFRADMDTPVSGGDRGIFLVRTDAAGDEVGGRDVWVTDGTAPGTRRVGTIAPESTAVSRPSIFVTVEDRVLFQISVDDRRELWAVDLGSPSPGPDALTRLAVVDPADSSFFYINNSLRAIEAPAGGSRAAFVALTEASGLEPWITDGTPEGTRMIADLCPGPCSSVPTFGMSRGFAFLDGRLVFAARDDAEVSIWQIRAPDGDLSRLPVTCDAACSSRDFSFLGFDDGRILWSNRDGLRVSDGTPVGTTALAEVELATDLNLDLGRGALIDGRVVFDGVDRRGAEPWTTDGTPAGTSILVDALEEDASSLPRQALAFDGEIVFEAETGRDLSGDPISGTWRSDGTEAGTVRLGSGDADDPWSAVAQKRVLGDALFLVANTADGIALWATADLETPLERLTPFLIDPGFVFPFPPTPPLISLGDVGTVSSGLVFCLETELWRSDGTAAGTTRIDLSVDFQTCGGFETVGDTAIFEASEEGDTLTSIWRTDGTVVGTKPLSIDGVMPFTGPNQLVPVGESLLITRPTDAGTAFWRVDGDGDPVQIAGPDDFEVRILGTVGARALVTVGPFVRQALFALDLEGRNELLIADAEDASGFFAVQPVEGNPASALRYVRRGGNVEQLWSTDGTPAGTRLTLSGGVIGRNVSQLRDRALLKSQNIFRSVTVDGRIENLASGIESAIGDRGRVIDGVLVLPVRDVAQRENLWRSDGTTEGTFPLTDFALDPLPARPEILGPAEDRLMFSAFRRATGAEPWALDRADLGAPRLALRADNRFEVEVRWTQPDGETRFGVPRRLTDDTGAFYFQRESNTELVIKVLDGRSVNGHFWVFYGALSNLEYTVTVTDTETGQSKVYDNPAGRFASVGDTRAFDVPGTSTAVSIAATPEPRLEPADPATRGTLACVLTVEALCLQQERFAVRVEWEKPSGETGVGTAMMLSSDTGFFSFFRESNVELIVKVLDGRDVNGSFWVFYGALSNLRYRLTVTDTATGVIQVYENPAGSFGSVGDTQAFVDP